MPTIDPLTADFAARFPDSFARKLSRAELGDITTVLNNLPPKVKASIVARLPSLQISELLNSTELAPPQWLIDAPFDDAVTLLSRLPRERRMILLNSLSDAGRKRRLLRHQQYPVHSVGAHVSDVLLRIRCDTPAVDVVKELRAIENGDPTTVVMVDADGHYFGLLNLWRLLASERPSGQVQEYAVKVAPMLAETPVNSAVQNEAWFKYNWIPVVDHQQRVLGGVKRARLFRAANAQMFRQPSVANTFVGLATDMVHVLANLIQGVLAPKGK